MNAQDCIRSALASPARKGETAIPEGITGELECRGCIYTAVLNLPTEIERMNPGLQTAPGYVRTGALAEQRDRVLRNTYWLLALSMVPTVLGAWIGVSTGLAAAMSPGIA